MPKFKTMQDLERAKQQFLDEISQIRENLQARVSQELRVKRAKRVLSPMPKRR